LNLHILQYENLNPGLPIFMSAGDNTLTGVEMPSKE
jgi:hypothetical protein